MTRKLIWGALLAGSLISAGCSGGGGGVAATQEEKGTASLTTKQDGTTATGATVGTGEVTATIPGGTVLTDGDGTPVAGTIAAKITYSDRIADLPDASLPTGAELLSFVNIILTNSQGQVVTHLSQDMVVSVKVPGLSPGNSVIHYRFNGESWVAEETATVRSDFTVEIRVNRSSYHALFRHTAADSTPPSVVMVSPENGSSNVPGNTRVLAVFSEPMDGATINAGTFFVTVFASDVDFGTVSAKALSETPVNGTVYYDAASRSAVFKATDLLPRESIMIATVTTGVKDLAGNSMAVEKKWSFSKQTTLDLTSPCVAETIPSASGSLGVSDEIVVKFTELMDPATIEPFIFLTEPSIAATVTYDPVSNSARLKPKAPLTAGVKYTITVKGTAKDLAGNPLVPFTWSFTPQ